MKAGKPGNPPVSWDSRQKILEEIN